MFLHLKTPRINQLHVFIWQTLMGKKVLILKYSFSFLTSFAYFYRFIIIY